MNKVLSCIESFVFSERVEMFFFSLTILAIAAVFPAIFWLR